MLRNSMNSKNFVINLNKPKDISSQKAVTKVKQIFAAKKAGHAGTLDPIATGVLLICLNGATKIARFLSDLDKEYIVRLKLGERTDTHDSTGKIVEKKNWRLLKKDHVYEVVNKFKGSIKQTPPMYSAIKIGGQRLYKLARMGMDVKRQERTINIYKIDIIYFNPPFLDLKISCSKGTYVRTLCDDIGKALGSGAHMVSLERTRIGNFSIEDSSSMEELISKKDAWYSIDSAISHLCEIILDEVAYYKARNGMPIIAFKNNPPESLHTPSVASRTDLWKRDNPPESYFNKGGLEGDFKVTKGGVSCKNLYINQYVRLKNPDNILFGIGILERNMIRIERLLEGSS
jgi:tRNA pseudouridine55 synthase